MSIAKTLFVCLTPRATCGGRATVAWGSLPDSKARSPGSSLGSVDSHLLRCRALVVNGRLVSERGVQSAMIVVVHVAMQLPA